MNLFTPIVPADRLHPNFKNVSVPHFMEGHKTVQKWADGFVDRDGKFVKEFQLTFNSSFLELYVFAVLKELGATVDFAHDRPDFITEKAGERIIIEVTTTGAADGKAKEWERELSVENLEKDLDLWKINKEAIIRLSNSIYAKHRKYKEEYCKLPHVSGRPFVIAVAPFEQPHFYLQADRPIRALLYDHYVDEAAYFKNPSIYPFGPPVVNLGTIEKDNGREIELGFFNTDAMEEVSAIMFSQLATWGKVTALTKSNDKYSFFDYLRNGDDGSLRRFSNVPMSDYHETLIDGLQVYHNPNAKHPLSPDFFRAPGVVQHYFNFETGEWEYEGMENALLFRRVTSVRVKTDE